MHRRNNPPSPRRPQTRPLARFARSGASPVADGSHARRRRDPAPCMWRSALDNTMMRPRLMPRALGRYCLVVVGEYFVVRQRFVGCVQFR